MGDLPYPRGAFADTCARVLDVVEGDSDDDETLYGLEARLRAWWLESRADGYPSRASGAEPSTGGATNVVHDFGTVADPELQEVPQHSDPTGEIVAGRDGDEKLQALCTAWEQLATGAALLLQARTTIRRALYPPEALDTQLAEARSREWCWSCLRLRVGGGERHCSPVYRERAIGADRVPLCRSCYDWVGTHGGYPPVPVVGVWARGERLTTSKLAGLGLDDQGRPLPAQKPKPKAKRKRRR